MIMDKLKEIVALIEQEVPGSKSSAYCDSVPFLEKAHAAKSGMGWIGKNSLLIIPQKGFISFFRRYHHRYRTGL